MLHRNHILSYLSYFDKKTYLEKKIASNLVFTIRIPEKNVFPKPFCRTKKTSGQCLIVVAWINLSQN